MRRQKRAVRPVDRKKKKAVVKAVRKSVKKAVRRVVPRAVLPKPATEHPVYSSVPAPAWEDKRIPSHYNEDKLVLLTRDPWWLFAYWEVTSARQNAVTSEARASRASGMKTVLRVYDVTGGLVPPKAHSYFDIELNFHADNWYVDVGMPDREWVAEIGFRAADGRFFMLVRSNRVRTPAFGISDVLDEEWMLPEEIYYRLIGRSLGDPSSGGSMDIRKLLEKYLLNVASSERAPELSKRAQ